MLADRGKTGRDDVEDRGAHGGSNWNSRGVLCGTRAYSCEMDNQRQALRESQIQPLPSCIVLCSLDMCFLLAPTSGSTLSRTPAISRFPITPTEAGLSIVQRVIRAGRRLRLPSPVQSQRASMQKEEYRTMFMLRRPRKKVGLEAECLHVGTARNSMEAVLDRPNTDVTLTASWSVP